MAQPTCATRKPRRRPRRWGLTVRENLRLKDGLPEDEEKAILELVGAIRRHRPRTVLANALYDRHTDHGRAAELVHRACFLAGLARIETTEPDGTAHAAHRPAHVLHYIQDRFREPSIVVDITGAEHAKYAAIACYSSQVHVPGAAEGQVEVPSASDLATPISTPDHGRGPRPRHHHGGYIGVLSGEGSNPGRRSALATCRICLISHSCLLDHQARHAKRPIQMDRAFRLRVANRVRTDDLLNHNQAL